MSHAPVLRRWTGRLRFKRVRAAGKASENQLQMLLRQIYYTELSNFHFFFGYFQFSHLSDRVRFHTWGDHRSKVFIAATPLTFWRRQTPNFHPHDSQDTDSFHDRISQINLNQNNWIWFKTTDLNSQLSIVIRIRAQHLC